jgi:integrase
MTVSKRATKTGSRWTAQVRYRGHSLAFTFSGKGDATSWEARVRADIEDSIRDGVEFKEDRWLAEAAAISSRGKINTEVFSRLGTSTKSPEQEQIEIDHDSKPRRDWTLHRALVQFENQVTFSKTRKGTDKEHTRIVAWQNHPYAKLRLCDLTREHITDYVKSRRITKGARKGDEVSHSTLNNEIGRISALYQLATTPTSSRFQHGAWGWGLMLENPATRPPIGRASPPRDRRLQTVRRDGRDVLEEDLLLAEIAKGQDPEQMRSIFLLGIETGTRRGELLDLRRNEIRETPGGPEIHLSGEKTKNGKPRIIQLSAMAWEIICQRLALLPPDSPGDARLFTLTGNQVGHRYRRAKQRAGLDDITQHDLRHEAVSRLDEAGWTDSEIMGQSGHSSRASMKRYSNKNRANVRSRLDRMDAERALPKPAAKPAGKDALMMSVSSG